MLTFSSEDKTKYEYTQNNVQILSGLIRYVCLGYSTKLLSSEYKNLHLKDVHPITGHCVYASESLYHLLENDTIHQMRAPCEKYRYHWYLQDVDGIILDPTAEQYYHKGILPPYNKGKIQNRPYGRDKEWNDRVLNKSLFVMDRVNELLNGVSVL